MDQGSQNRDPLAFNKLAASILVAGIAFMLTGFIAQALVHPTLLKHSVVKIAGVKEVQTAAVAAPAAPKIPNIVPYLLKADVAKGRAFVQQVCSSCHTFNKGGPATVGPNLYGVVGEKMFVKPGYSFSPAVKAVAKGDWTYNKLNHWLFDPQIFAPGTRMTFTGIKQIQMRADVIGFLRTLSDNPEPLPKPLPTTSAKSSVAAQKKAANEKTAPAATAPKSTSGSANSTVAPSSAEKQGATPTNGH